MAEGLGVRTARLCAGDEVDTKVFEQLDRLATFFTSLLIFHDTVNGGTSILRTTKETEVEAQFELVTTVVIDRIEHLQGGVTFLDKLGHGGRSQTSTLSILKSVVRVDADVVLRRTEVIADGQTLNGFEVEVVVRIIVLVGVGTGILDQLDKVAGLFIVSTDADSRILVEGLLETKLIGDSLRLEVGVVEVVVLSHVEVAQIVGSPVRRRTTGDNVIAGLELRIFTNGEGEGNTGLDNDLGLVVLECLFANGIVGKSLLTFNGTIRSGFTRFTSQGAGRAELHTIDIIPG